MCGIAVFLQQKAYFFKRQLSRSSTSPWWKMSDDAWRFMTGASALCAQEPFSECIFGCPVMGMQ